MPVNSVWIEDHHVSINTEDNCDDHYGHLEDLEEGMEEVRIKGAVQVYYVVSVRFVPLHDEHQDRLESEVAEKRETSSISQPRVPA